ncbi:MAG: hypothetical protein HY233_09990 [Acidobacteriales bacterium]|nr:hypothetical protein [Terriglobales bacterium]
MKNTTIVLLIVFVGVLSLLLYSQTAALREQRRQVQEMNAKLESISKTTSLDLQGKCAKQAQEAFKLRYPERASFENHYNTKLDKCFMQVAYVDKYGVSVDIIDAFEGKNYAVYTAVFEKGKGSQLALCNVKLPSDAHGEFTKLLPSFETKECVSRSQFDALVNKYYME